MIYRGVIIGKNGVCFTYTFDLFEYFIADVLYHNIKLMLPIVFLHSRHRSLIRYSVDSRRLTKLMEARILGIKYKTKFDTARDILQDFANRSQ